MKSITIASVVVALAMVLAVAGCGGSESESAGSGAAPVSGVSKEAADFLMAQIPKHWVKQPEGWVTARAAGSRLAPERFLRQIREITVSGVESLSLTESDRLNGIEWAGNVEFKRSPIREAGDDGILFEGITEVTSDRPKGRWSQWFDYSPEDIQVLKVKGQWQVKTNTFLFHGTLPTPEDFARAGVK